MAAVRAPPKRRAWSWRSQAFRGVVYQLLAVAVIGFALWFLAHNTLENMRARGIQSGFEFLRQPAGFDIGESLIQYDALDPYWKAFLVGILNTLRVAIVGIVLATVLGAMLGIGRFSRNAIVRGLCYGYVELFRNIPVLLQLLMWYLLFTEVLPPIAERRLYQFMNAAVESDVVRYTSMMIEMHSTARPVLFNAVVATETTSG